MPEKKFPAFVIVPREIFDTLIKAYKWGNEEGYIDEVHADNCKWIHNWDEGEWDIGYDKENCITCELFYFLQNQLANYVRNPKLYLLSVTKVIEDYKNYVGKRKESDKASTF